MSQVERVTARIVELIEEVQDEVSRALVDGQITGEEAKEIELRVGAALDLAADYDDAAAVGIAILRTGLTGSRSRRLLRFRSRTADSLPAA